MALLQCHFYSNALQIQAAMNVLLPEPKPGETFDGKYPTLYLLHGLSDDHSAWVRWTSVERYVRDRKLAVVMPAVNRSFYTDMEYGAKYWTFVSEELPAVARSFFPLSARREDNFVAGLSMGGYGAFKLALRCPDRFAAAASLSGALDVKTRGETWPNDFKYIFGGADRIDGSENDLFRLAEDLAASDGPKPKLFQACGTEDYLYEDNQRFLAHARKLGLELDYEEEPGSHNWEYWDMKIRRVLDWLPIAGNGCNE